MPSCEIIGYRFAARITYDLSQDLVRNQSTVHITKTELKTLWNEPIGSCWVTGSITVDAQNAAELRLSNTEACAVSVSQSYSGGGEGSWSGFSSKSVTLSHGTDGSLNAVSIRANLSIQLTSGTLLDPGINDAVQVDLPRIPRVTEIAAVPAALGSAVTVRLSRQAESFRDTVLWQCGTASGTVCSKTAEDTVVWTPQMSLASQEPNKTSVTVTLTAVTYSGDTEVGRRSVTVSCAIPASVVPGASLTLTDKMGYTSTHGGYIQGQSQLRVQTAASGAYGSAIRSVAVKCGSLTGTGTDVSFALPNSGTVAVTVTVIDSRGRTGTASGQISVTAYEKPKITLKEYFRCNAQGNRNPDGDSLMVIYDAKITDIPGNDAAYTLVRKDAAGTVTGLWTSPTTIGTFTVTGGTVRVGADPQSSADFLMRAQDSFHTVETAPVKLPAVFALIDFHKSSKSVGIGMRAKGDGTLNIGIQAGMNGNRITDLADPVNALDAANKRYVEAAAGNIPNLETLKSYAARIENSAAHVDSVAASIPVEYGTLSDFVMGSVLSETKQISLEIEQGSISGAGNKTDSTSRIRTKNRELLGYSLVVYPHSGYSASVVYYGSTVRASDWLDYAVTIPAGTRFGIAFRKSDNSAIGVSAIAHFELIAVPTEKLFTPMTAQTVTYEGILEKKNTDLTDMNNNRRVFSRENRLPIPQWCRTLRIVFDKKPAANASVIGYDAAGTLTLDSGWLLTGSATYPRTVRVNTQGAELISLYFDTTGYEDIDFRAIHIYFNEDSRDRMPSVGYRGDSALRQKLRHDLPAFLYPRKMHLIFHAGAGRRAPANSMAAFLLAGQDERCWGIETDIQKTADGVFVCYHDQTLDTLTTLTGRISELTYDQIRQAVYNTGSHWWDQYTEEHIVTLREYLQVCLRYGKVPVPELFASLSDADIREIYGILKEFGMEHSCMPLCDTKHQVDVLKAADPYLYCSWLCETVDNAYSSMTYAAENNIMLDVYYTFSTFNSGFLGTAHRNGVLVGSYTVSNLEDYLSTRDVGMIDFVTVDM